MKFYLWFIGALLCLEAVYANVTDADFERIEEMVFKPETADEVKRLIVAETGVGVFQNGLVYYRLGNLETNLNHTKKSVALLESVTNSMQSVYTFCYLGMAYAMFTMLTPNPVEKLEYLDKTKKILEHAVSNYPTHYLPRLYRGSMYIMMPDFVGGNIDLGLKDLEMVLAKMPTIKRDNNFKAFIYFLYGSVIADKKNKIKEGIDYIKKADALTDKDKMKEAVRKKLDELSTKGR